MRPAPFSYARPLTLEAALAQLADRPESTVLAGGQSLMPMLNFRELAPLHLIDINRITALDYVRLADGRLRLGAMTRQRTVEFSTTVADAMPLLAAAVRRLGHRQTRNRGTVGGSLCQTDPAAELLLVAALHDAEVVLADRHGRRALPVAEFALGARHSARRPDELCVELRLPTWPPGHGWGFHELSRRHADWAIASAAVLLTVDDDGRVDRLAVAIGAVEDVPRRLPRLETRLLGAQVAELATGAGDTIAAGLADEALAARDGVDAPGWYRAHLARVLVARAFADALQRVRKEVP